MPAAVLVLLLLRLGLLPNFNSLFHLPVTFFSLSLLLSSSVYVSNPFSFIHYFDRAPRTKVTKREWKLSMKEFYLRKGLDERGSRVGLVRCRSVVINMLVLSWCGGGHLNMKDQLGRGPCWPSLYTILYEDF